MENIKKLELPLNDPRRGIFNSGAGNIQIIRKINEIIDRLNEQSEETLVERVERKYNVNLGVDKDTKLEELLKQKGLPSMSETLEDTMEEWEEWLDKLYLGMIDERLYSQLKEDIEILLEEKEREAREEGYEEGFEDGLQDIKKIEREK